MTRKNVETMVVLFLGLVASSYVLDLLFPNHIHSKGWYLGSGWGPFLVSSVLHIGVLAAAIMVRARHDGD